MILLAVSCLLRYANLEGNATQNTKIAEISTTRAVREIEAQIVKKHLFIIVLKALSKESLSGYGIILLVHREYGVLLGAGMVYNLLHSLEKKHLIKAKNVKKAKYCLLTEKGEEALETIIANRSMLRNMADLLF